MRFILIALLLLLSHYVLTAQDCNCTDKLRFAQLQIEKNYAGFSDKVTGNNRKAYDAYTAAHFLQAGKIKKPAVCLKLINDWIRFFKDGHIQVAGNAGDADAATMQARIDNTEVINLSDAQIGGLTHSATPEEGIYTSSDSTYTIAVIKSKNDYRDLAGIVLESKAESWKKGQVKLELKKRAPNKYDAIVYMRDHSYRIHEFTFDSATFNGEWKKAVSKRATGKQDNTRSYGDVLAKKINNNTLYVQIGTFDGSNARAIDSVMKANEPLLKTMPNLILDLRGNGGGSDYSYQSILPWIYTQPVITTGVDVWCTPDNVKGWKTMTVDDPDFPEDMKEGIRTLLGAMEHNPGKFMPTNADDTTSRDEVRPYPKKVVVLIDGFCGSTTEQFLLEARQSRKVTLMGTHTGGILDYANVRPSAPPPCRDMALYYATTRSRRLNKGQGIDNVGIQPDVILSKGTDWITAAAKYMAGAGGSTGK